MAVKLAGDVLRADAATTALVPASRITPIIRPQSITTPAITLQRISKTPQNHLRGWGTLDANLVQVDVWADSYLVARNIADTARAALQAATYIMDSELDDYDEDVDPPLYRITQTWQVWTS